MYFLFTINAPVKKIKETIEIITPILNGSDEYSSLTLCFPSGMGTALKV